jgi:hypothetical protein
MKRSLFVLFIFPSLFVLLPSLALAGSQTWKVQPGDHLDVVSTTLDIPKEEIRKHNPGVLENNLQIGQQLKLPLRSFAESKALEERLTIQDARIRELEKGTVDLERQIARAQSRLIWHPIWLWGFWICFGVIALIASGAYWLFRQTHPQVFEEPHERSVRDLRQSQVRVRSFPYDEEGANSSGGHWQPPLRHATGNRH